MLARLGYVSRRSLPIRFRFSSGHLQSQSLQSLQRRSTGTQSPDASGEAFKNKRTSSQNWEAFRNNFRNNSPAYGVVLASAGAFGSAVYAAARHTEKTNSEFLMLKEKFATELARVEAVAKAEKEKSAIELASELARVEAVAKAEKETSASELARVKETSASELARVKAELVQAVAVAEKNTMQQFMMYGYSNEYKQFQEKTHQQPKK